MINIKISVLTSKLKIELREKLIRCYVWSNALYGSEKFRTEVFGELRNVVLEENREDKMLRESN